MYRIRTSGEGALAAYGRANETFGNVAVRLQLLAPGPTTCRSSSPDVGCGIQLAAGRITVPPALLQRANEVNE